jgi:hypothetical protein
MSTYEETLASLMQTAEQLRVHLDTVEQQERERSHPTALEMAGRKYGYWINLMTEDPDKEKFYVPACDVMFLYNRLWITDPYGETRVFEATDDPNCFNAILAKLPELDSITSSTIAGAEVPVRLVDGTKCQSSETYHTTQHSNTIKEKVLPDVAEDWGELQRQELADWERRERQGLADWKRFLCEKRATAALSSMAVYRIIDLYGNVIEEIGPLGAIECDDLDNTERVNYKGDLYVIDRSAKCDNGKVLAVREV